MATATPSSSYDEQTVASAVEAMREELVYVFTEREPRAEIQPADGNPRLSPAELAPCADHAARPHRWARCAADRPPHAFSRPRRGRGHARRRAEGERSSNSPAAGRKEARYAHLLSGAARPAEEPRADRERARVRDVRPRTPLARLETEVETLRGELAELQRRFDEFRKQFE